ncbi:DUF721 domain-containing protein [Bdellovibrionota bacterium FG-2]
MSFNRLTDILDLLKRHYPSLAKRVKEAQALSNWDTIVGPQIAKNAKPLRVEDAVLWVEVRHPIWRMELGHRKKQILDKLNQATQGEKPLLDLKFVELRSDLKD